MAKKQIKILINKLFFKGDKIRRRNIFKLLILIILLLFYGCAPKPSQPQSQGVITWQKVFGRSDSDQATSIQQTTDVGYIVAGYTDSFGAGDYDAYIIKLDADGNIRPYPTQ